MKQPITHIRVFYDRKGNGKLIAIVRDHIIGRWYTYNSSRVYKLSDLTQGCHTVYTEQAMTIRPTLKPF